MARFRFGGRNANAGWGGFLGYAAAVSIAYQFFVYNQVLFFSKNFTDSIAGGGLGIAPDYFFANNNTNKAGQGSSVKININIQEEPKAQPKPKWWKTPFSRKAASAATSKPKQQLVFLWGIETGSSLLEATRRQVIRQSYLSRYHNSTTPHRICSLNDLSSNPHILFSSAGCEVAYTFFQVVESSAVSSTTTTDENDIVYLEDAQETTSGVNISSSSRTSLAWFRYASSLEIPFDYIAKVDSDTIMLPDLLLKEATKHVDRNRKPSPTLEYAATSTSNDEFNCKHIPANECPNFNGRFYYLSRDLASSLVGSSMEDIMTSSLFDDVSYNTKPEEEIILQLLLTRTATAQSNKKVKRKDLGRLLTRKDPTEFLNYWHTHRSATRAFQKLQRDYNTSITYVTGKFGRNAPFKHSLQNTNNWVVASGLQPHQVHVHSSFPDFISNDKRWERHLEFLTNETAPTRGGGYWFWKGPLIQHYFDKLRDGEILIFTDADVLDGWGWTHKLLETMLQKQHTFALFETDFEERHYTKQDVLRKYCGADVSRAARRLREIYSANFLVFIKSPGTTRFLQHWTDGLADFHLVSDEPSVVPNVKVFEDNRHDQSILSTMLKCQYNEIGKELFDGAFTLGDWTLPMFRI
jgi:hypothetical protein